VELCPYYAVAERVELVAGIIGAEGAIGGFTPLVEWVAPLLHGAKQRDFALTLGPVVTTPDEGMPPGIDWERLVAYAAENTRLYPGDVIAA
jgi:2-keto-4-pentenoate hydratase/2-oxohepta-3-ene-1,7-dioic acid hydratase in catechol pathway